MWLKSSEKASEDRWKHSARPDSSETSKGAFSSLSCELASSQASKMRPAEMFGLIALTQRWACVMLKQARYSYWKAYWSLSGMSDSKLWIYILRCQSVVYTVWVNLVQRENQIWETEVSKQGNWGENGFTPNPRRILQYSLEALGATFMFLPSLTESMSSLCWSRHWSPPPPHPHPHRISKQVRVTAL